MADSKFAQLLASKKIDPRRVLAASHKLETLQRDDRAIKLAKRKVRKGGDENAVKETRKPRTGRPVTPRAMEVAMTGGTLSGPTKTRLLRAVNAILATKKQEPVDLRALF